VVAMGTLKATALNALGSASKVTVGPTGQLNGAELDINADQTVASVTMGSIAGTDTITIASGQTLTVTGNDGTTSSNSIVGSSFNNAFRVGGNASSGAVTTTAVVSGAGTLNINSPSANFAMDNVNSPVNGNNATATLDMSGLATFSANVSNFRVGYGSMSAGILTLATNNTITASSTLEVGDSNNQNASSLASSMILGQTNTLNTSTLNIGAGASKGVGTVFFNSTLTNPTLVIRGTAGGNSAANMNIGTLTGTAAVPGLSSLVLTAGAGRSGGSIDAIFSTVIIGKGSLAGNTGVDQGLFEFDKGTVIADSVFLGVAVTGSTSSGTGTNTNTGTINVKGGSLTVTSALVLGTIPANTTQNAVGILNITGGTVTLGNDMTDGGGGSTVNLDGGTLDMGGHNISSGGQNIDTLTLASGTLQNVNEINTGSPVSKTTSGVLILAGVNNYSGVTTVSAGTLQVGVGGAGQGGTGDVVVNGAGAALAGTGTVRGATTITNGVIRPGDNAGAGVGTLNIQNSLTFNPSSASTVAEFSILNSGSADRIHVSGALTLSGSSNFVVTFDPGYNPAGGDSWQLLDWTGLLTMNGFDPGALSRTGSNAAGNEGNLDLPDLTASGMHWSVSALNDGASGGALIVSIVPEPSRALLIMTSLCALALRRRRSGIATAL